MIEASHALTAGEWSDQRLLHLVQYIGQNLEKVLVLRLVRRDFEEGTLELLIFSDAERACEEECQHPSTAGPILR